MFAILRKWFISGLLVWLPIWVTLLVMSFLVDLLSKSLLLLPAQYQPDKLFGFHLPGSGVVLTIAVILITGMFAANLVGKRLVSFWDKMLGRIPLVRSIYNGVKQVTETLFTPGGPSFRKVLLVEYPSPGIWSLAFQTGQVGKEIETRLGGGEPMVSYFVPTTPNPTSGFLMMAPKSKVIELDISVDQALKFIISLGVMQPGTGPFASQVKG